VRSTPFNERVRALARFFAAYGFKEERNSFCSISE
jgi:hypothetical protein